MEFKEVFKELRKEKGLTAQYLAKQLKFSKNLVYEWEKGRSQPNVETLIEISHIFDVTVDYLVGNSDELGNVGTTEQFSPEELELVKCYRGIGNAERLALLTTAKSFYSQAKARAGGKIG